MDVKVDIVVKDVFDQTRQGTVGVYDYDNGVINDGFNTELGLVMEQVFNALRACGYLETQLLEFIVVKGNICSGEDSES